MNSYTKGILIVVFAGLFFTMGWVTHKQEVILPIKKKPTLLQQIKKHHKLNVVLLNSPTTYYIGASSPQGFEYDLLKAYANHLNVELNITTADTVNEAIQLSKNPNVHITSASLAKTAKRKKIFNFGPSYFEVQEQVICRRDMLTSKKFPRDVEDLAGLRITVGAGTSYSETIKNLQDEGFDINATFTTEYSTTELLEQVATNKIDCTIADSNIYALNLRYFTEIANAFTISSREQLAWVLAPDSKELESDLYSWLNSYNQSGAMGQLKDYYYGYVQFFDYFNIKMFYKRIKSRLPKYEKYFIYAGKRYNLPWKLLASISYQESLWNARARSYTGVKGLMMLTRHTAKLLGIKNRLNPKQSIIGGTRHLKQMIKLVPKDVKNEDRLKFALASYNIGFGHILDARALARKMRLNPSVWNDIKQTLPLLAHKRYYRKLKYGYARGSEPVRYVESIYNFKDILENNCDGLGDKVK